MKLCGNCSFIIDEMCNCEKSIYFKNHKNVDGVGCCWWKGDKKDENYDLEAINKALAPLCVTFEELFRKRHTELFFLESELKYRAKEFWHTNYEGQERILALKTELEAMVDEFLCRTDKQ